MGAWANATLPSPFTVTPLGISCIFDVTCSFVKCFAVCELGQDNTIGVCYLGYSKYLPLATESESEPPAYTVV